MLPAILLAALCGTSFASPAPAPVPEDPEPVPSTVPAYMTSTYIHYPAASNWWTLGVTNQVTWQWASEVVDLRIVLSNNRTSMMAHTESQLVASIPANSFSFTTKVLVGPVAGTGYQLTLCGAKSNLVYAVSDPFEIKPMGSDPDPPKPYRVHSGVVGVSARPGWVLLAVLVAVLALR